MKVLIASTEDFIKYGRSTVSATTAKGTGVSLPLTNATEYAVNDYLCIGVEGSDNAEICLVTGVTGNTVTVTTLFAHEADEPVVKYRYNKRKFYGCVTQSGSFSELTSSGSPKNITVNNPQGTLLEYTGGEGYLYFKSTYFNSTDSTESNLLDAAVSNGDESLRYCSIYAIKKQAGLTRNPYITDDIVEGYRKRAENEINSFLSAKYVIPLTNKTTNATEVPAIVENIAVLLAAGYMDWQEFGKDGEGVKWLSDARSTLKKLQSPGGQQLLGTDNNEMLTRTLSNGVQGYPNTVDNNNGPARFFTMGQKF